MSAPSAETYRDCVIWLSDDGWMWRDHARLMQGGPFRFKPYVLNDVDMYRRESAQTRTH